MDLYLDRSRALSFGSVAELYDRYRPAYPEALLDDLMAARPADALDVGCGTGQVARALLRRGVSVLGLEPDAYMASICVRHGVSTEVTTFEEWNDDGHQFDLIASGTAWHWIDPIAGLAKAARVLRSGGTLARFWTHEVPEESALGKFYSLYEQLAPTARPHLPVPPADRKDPIDDDSSFTSVQSKTYRWSRTVDSDIWVGLATTFSDHQRLEPERLAALQSALRGAINSLGGTIRLTCGTFATVARRA